MLASIWKTALNIVGGTLSVAILAVVLLLLAYLVYRIIARGVRLAWRETQEARKRVEPVRKTDRDDSPD